MGFTPEMTTIRLRFQDQSDLAGLEVDMRSVSVRVYNRMLHNSIVNAKDFVDANEFVFGEFITCLVSWNLTNPDGTPVPTTREGVEAQDTNLITRLISAWQVGLTSVPTRPPLPSSNGEPPSRTEEQTLGLASASQSPGS